MFFHILCSNNCRTSIVDFHRSCPKCTYDLCLSCCREIRAGKHKICDEVITEYVDRGYEYLHGEIEQKSSGNGPVRSKRIEGKNSRGQSKGATRDREVEVLSEGQNKKIPEWKADEKGNIPCPPEKYGGCGEAHLELKSFLSGKVSELLEEAEEIVSKWEHEHSPQVFNQCTCSDLVMDVDAGSNLRKCAAREDSKDNYLYCPDAKEIKHSDLKHFQQHWTRGEPVIVRNILETTSGLSWEPLVMWRAVRQIKNTKHSTLLDVKAIDCLDWCEVRAVLLAAKGKFNF